MRILFTIICAHITMNVFPQIIHLSGIVLDAETLTPVSNVSIFTKDNKTGTVSTIKGNFAINIPDSKTNGYLYFTSIGYEPDSLLISKAVSPLSIQLIPKTYLLKEAYIMSDSTLLTLLRKAYSKIPENYPDQPTRYDGFFQESASQKDSLVELIEAELAVYKESYTKMSEMRGQVEIVKSRIKKLQSIPVGFIGGAFIPIEGDAVLQRKNYISPAKMKYYKYDFLGIKNDSGKDYYEIQFYPLNKDSANIKGNMLIDTETLAYASFEISEEKKGNAKVYIGPIKPTETIVKIFYEPFNGKWFLKHISSRNTYENIRLKNTLYSSLDFIVTSIQTDSVKPIPIEKRLEYLEPIEAKVEDYTPQGWTDYEMIANKNLEQLEFQFSTDEALSIFNQKSPKKKISFAEIVIKIIPKLKISYGLSYNFDQQIPIYQSSMGYRLNKKWCIQWQSSEDLFIKNVRSSENSLGIEFRKNMNSAGYPLFLGTSLGIADSRFHSESESIKEYLIIPQLSLSKRASKFFTLELFVNYPLVLHSNINPNHDVNHYPRVGINMFIF